MQALARAFRRRLWWLALVAGVSLAHLWGTERLGAAMQLGRDAAEREPRRIDVAFVRELQQTAPPPAPAPAVRKATRRRAAVPAVAPASAPEAAPPEAASPEIALAEPAPVAEPPAEAASAADLAASAAPPEAAAAPASASEGAAPAAPASAAGPAFEWPPSTRLSYTLTGYYQGPVDGGAQVEWLRSGNRYQVHLDVHVGPGFAPLVSRRMSSDGELSDQGLRPLRYDEVTRVALREPRRQTVTFEPDRVVLAGGRTETPLPGVQDTASQFVQLTWLFTTQPQRLRVGETIELPLALPRRMDRWIYLVRSEEVLQTPAGRVLTYHVQPQREVRREGELLVETWFAPTLQYLPVRIRIRQDAETFVDLMIDRLPQQAGPEPVAAPR